MKIVIDSANVKEIRDLYEYFPIDGVTTNPSIIVKEQQTFFPLLKEIRKVIGEEKELFVQVISGKAENIVEEARYVTNSISGDVVIKVPVTIEGIKAIKLLKAEGIRTLATTVYTPLSAFVAAKAGADYVAPYVNRIDNLGDGTNVVSEITRIFSIHNLPCQVLAASFKNVKQLLNVTLAGAHGITTSPELIRAMLEHPSIEKDVCHFRNEWAQLYGKEATSLMV
ncbi:transaldolase family protein [Robertmurraya sp. FSL R5-0851]|uniref:transaldolase family protein n=1 Tax=Robertmurraya sp. FSL R5-0851 TaxID=2921584 RepID=UPI0030FBAF31